MSIYLGGFCVGAIRGCTLKEPTVVGKPSSLIIDYILDRLKSDSNNSIDRSRVCMVGDRLDTDVQFGLSNGLTTLLTLSGVTSIDSMRQANADLQPHYYVESIADLLIKK